MDNIEEKSHFSFCSQNIAKINLYDFNGQLQFWKHKVKSKQSNKVKIYCPSELSKAEAEAKGWEPAKMRAK